MDSEKKEDIKLSSDRAGHAKLGKVMQEIAEKVGIPVMKPPDPQGREIGLRIGTQKAQRARTRNKPSRLQQRLAEREHGTK